jgi:hypothetical protein
MTTNKKLVSTRISEEDYGLMQIICEREKLNAYDLLAKLIKKETDKVRGTNPDVFPTIGEPAFEYDPESDSFIWSVHTGKDSPFIVSSKLSPHFVESIFAAIKKGIDRRGNFLKQIKKNKTFIPDSIKRFKEN